MTEPTRAELVIIIQIMRRYVKELTAVADASEGMVLADTVRMYLSAAKYVSEEVV